MTTAQIGGTSYLPSYYFDAIVLLPSSIGSSQKSLIPSTHIQRHNDEEDCLALIDCIGGFGSCLCTIVRCPRAFRAASHGHGAHLHYGACPAERRTDERALFIAADLPRTGSAPSGVAFVHASGHWPHFQKADRAFHRLPRPVR